MRTCCAILALLLVGACGPSADAPSQKQEPIQPAPPAQVGPVAPLDRGDGLTVEIVSAGHGDEVTGTSEVSLHYSAFVEGVEKPFDASDDSGVPLRVQLGPTGRPRVIEGLARGLVGLRVGTQAKLHIPPALGWGAAGNPQAGVPADAVLVYDVQVLEVR
jgi:FKBP-type peptidyl-prolyl cis-trans isomerase